MVAHQFPPLSRLLPAFRPMASRVQAYPLAQRAAVALLKGTGAIATVMMVGCGAPFSASSPGGDAGVESTVSPEAGSGVVIAEEPSAQPPSPAPSAKPSPAPVKALPNAANEVGDTYKFALDKAYSAAKLSQSARAMSDWEFVVSRWQEAINLLKTIEGSDPRAPGKIAEYSKNLAYAQRRASQVPTPPKPIRIQAPAQTASAQNSPSVRVGRSVPVPASASAGSNRSPDPQAAAGNGGETKVPIRRRFGGIPIILVQINGQGFPMMVDTGASTTVVTQAMANGLGLEPTGSVRANTPSQQGAVFQVTRLDRIQVGNLEARNLNAAIAPSMEVGLLGQNFFGAYAVTINRNEVIFRPQS